MTKIARFPQESSARCSRRDRYLSSYDQPCPTEKSLGKQKWGFPFQMNQEGNGVL